MCVKLTAGEQLPRVLILLGRLGLQALPERVQTLVRYFRERPQPIPTLYVMGQEDHMFLAPVREQVPRCQNSCRLI